MNHAPIGMVDSGIGGLTILDQVSKILPYEQVIYFADTLRLPYGSKSPETILSYFQNHLCFFREQKVKLLVVACHTIATALTQLNFQFEEFPIISVSLPSIEKFTSMISPKLAILGTEATINSNVYQTILGNLLPNAEINAIACPSFASLIEYGDPATSFGSLIVDYHLSKITQPIDGLILACTHYPLLKPQFSNKLGYKTLILDPSIDCAIKVQEFLREKHLLSDYKQNTKPLFYSSSTDCNFKTKADVFLNKIQQMHYAPR